MILLKIPCGHFTRLAYPSTRSVLTINTDRVSYVTRLWDLTRGAAPVDLTGLQAYLARFAFRPGGTKFLRVQGAWLDGERLPVAERAEHIKSLLVANSDSWLPFAFGPDGATVLYRHAGRIDGAYQTHFHLRTPDGATHGLYQARGMFTTSAAFSPDGRLAAMSSGTKVVAVWDVTQRREVHQFVHAGRVNAVAFTSNDRLVVAAGRSVCMWKGVDGNAVKKFRAFRKFVDAVAVSPDLRFFAAGDRNGLVRVWDSASGHEIREYEWGVGQVKELAFSPDGATAAVAGISTVAVWDLD